MQIEMSWENFYIEKENFNEQIEITERNTPTDASLLSSEAR
ncbi:16750_t:CDS:2 [Cetraspora pellucida]|uniref:16750_t:CDS:1 n=1 Tax=Cetraspora pellucida TaxID=1433469 RepID=A0A9N9DBW9_9GLOM|nr:16750_t:CDS:2 [Cetraspora pellucida]